MSNTAYKRAEMPTGASQVLDERTLEKSNANLLPVLKKGMYVLDVGCGSGAITKGIADYTGEDGLVVGIDRSKELIDQAIGKYAFGNNVRFECADILNYQTALQFDIITTARTLQWIANPAAVIGCMKGLLKHQGLLCVLDYNHTQVQWDPQPPESMLKFYSAFLKWRSDAGMDNEIGDHVAGIMEENQLKVRSVGDHSEYFEKGDEGFQTHLNIWKIVADTRGKQLVQDKYLTEAERETASLEYAEWCQDQARSMKLILKATHGQK